MIEVKIKISEVDYSAAVDVLMPVMRDKPSASANPIISIVLRKPRACSPMPPRLRWMYFHKKPKTSLPQPVSIITARKSPS